MLGRVAPAVRDDAVKLVVVVGMRPRAIIVVRLSAIQQGGRAELLRCAEHDPLIFTSRVGFDGEEVQGRVLRNTT